MNRANEYLPLRQTCNRCRDLKVRCQSRYSVIAPNDEDSLASCQPCLRCSRTGANCTFSCKYLHEIYLMPGRTSSLADLSIHSKTTQWATTTAKRFRESQ